MSLSGESVKKVCDDEPYTLYADGRWVYYRAYNRNNRVVRVKTDGTSRAYVTSFPVSWLLVHDGILYFTDRSDDFYYRMNPDGSNKMLLTKEKAYLPTYYNDRIYFSDGYASIWSMRPDGTDLKILAENAGYHFNLSDGRLYCLSADEECVLSMDLDGKDVCCEQQLSGMKYDDSVDYSNNAIYATEQTLVVPDVDAFPGHIACSSLSRSEIVVPIHHPRDGHIVGVLDVDSQQLADFDDTDRQGLQAVVAALMEVIC